MHQMQDAGSPIIPIFAADCSKEVYGGKTPYVSPAPVGKEWWVTEYPYVEGYKGDYVFPEEYNFYEDPVTGLRVSVPCYDSSSGVCIAVEAEKCPSTYRKSPYYEPFLECLAGRCDKENSTICSEKVCPDWWTSYTLVSKCGAPCLEPCPPITYTDTEYRTMWMCYVLPATISLPFNIYIYLSFSIGSKTVHKKSRPMLKTAALLSVLWVVFDILPSLSLYTSMVCQGEFPEEKVTLMKGQKLGCHALRGTIHILQCMYYWVASAILDLYLAVVWEKILAKRDDVLKKTRVLCYGVPLLMCMLSYALQERDGKTLASSADGNGITYPNRTWNTYRDMFTCRPFLNSFEIEFVLVYLHFIICGFAIGVMLFFVTKHIILQGMKGEKMTSRRFGKMAKSLKKSGSEKLILLGALSTILLVLNVIVIVLIVPKFEDFGIQIREYGACLIQSNVQFKGDPCLEQGAEVCCADKSPFVNGGPAPGYL